MHLQPLDVYARNNSQENQVDELEDDEIHENGEVDLLEDDQNEIDGLEHDQNESDELEEIRRRAERETRDVRRRGGRRLLGGGSPPLDRCHIAVC